MKKNHKTEKMNKKNNKNVLSRGQLQALKCKRNKISSGFSRFLDEKCDFLQFVMTVLAVIFPDIFRFFRWI